MVQKNLPYINKSGHSMFWNSMWEDKNNFYKNLQKDFFIKSFINFFFSDYIFNQFFYKFNFKKNLDFCFTKYDYNFSENSFKKPNNIKLYLNKSFDNSIILSKIWFFKYQNWLVLYFYIFSKQTHNPKQILKFSKNSNYFYNYLNNYYFNLNNYNNINSLYKFKFKNYNF